MDQPRPLLTFIFGLFKQTSLQFLQQEYVKKCPSSIQSQDSNPQSLEHESPPITARPGLPPSCRLFLQTFFRKTSRAVNKKAKKWWEQLRRTQSVVKLWNGIKKLRKWVWWKISSSLQFFPSAFSFFFFAPVTFQERGKIFASHYFCCWLLLQISQAAPLAVPRNGDPQSSFIFQHPNSWQRTISRTKVIHSASSKIVSST